MMLIDTNVFVDHLRNYAPAVRFFESIANRDDVGFSAITEAELLAGKANDNEGKREKLLQFLHQWYKEVVNNPVSTLAGDISRRYGLTIPDAVISATCLLNNAELVTKNTKDFSRVSNLKVKVPY